MENEGSQSIQRIGFGRRLGAYLLDGLTVGILGSVIGPFAGAGLGELILGSQLSAIPGMEDLGMGAVLGGMFGFVGGTIILGFLNMLLEGVIGQTIGKMILGIKVGNQDGSTADIGKMMGRACLKSINGICTLLAALVGVDAIATIGSIGGLVIFVGCFLVLGGSKLSIHDMVTKTAIYRKGEMV